MATKDASAAAARQGLPSLPVVLLSCGSSPTPVKGEEPRLPDFSRHEHLGLAFAKIARAAANRPALLKAQTGWTYTDLLAAALTVRDRILAQRSFRVGDRIVLWLPNGAEYIAAFYGTLLAGGVVVPVPPDAEAHRLQHVITVCEPRLLLTHASVVRRRPCPSACPPETLRTDLSQTGEVKDNPGELPKGDAPAAIFFTSGSAGTPKGVTLSHRNLLSNADSIRKYLPITADERALGLLPFYHAFGNSVLQTHLLSGASIVLEGSLLFPETILDAIIAHGVTSVSGVPDMFRTLLARTSFGARELPSLKYMAVAGGRLDPDQALVVAFRAAPAKLFIMYGQTEATARLSYLPPESLETRFGSIGRGIPGVELQVVDPTGEPVAPGEIGEIRARGANVMLGYWRDPSATASVLRDGWLYTGDLATVDADGFIYPQGRQSGLVKIAGHRVHPAELEDFVRREGSVLEAVAVPFESPTGTRLALFAQPWEQNSSVTAEGLQRLCASRLPRHLVPEYVEIVGRFPLNDSYKVDRHALVRRAETIAVPR